mmetsp:Transcript_18216/g.31013  ORF Transcript_18216/g.31013 Transcript_18216/m.31013 type:complete len:494 (-) Transcript_18216:92-1573(-)
MTESSTTTHLMTTSSGMPVDNNQHSITAGPRGPIVMNDVYYIEKIQAFDRERIPERVVHAKGAGAKGYFIVTKDVTKYCKADFLSSIGKKTPVIARFSTVGGEKGSADVARDPRGFSLKFYTEEGNYDMVGNNTPVFFIRDPIKFPDFIHTQKRHPQTNLKDPNMFWDFLSLSPESIHQVTILFSLRGTPDGFRHMNGYSSHTFKWVNADGKEFWVKKHFKTDAGIKNLTQEEATKIAGEDPDYSTRDLFEHIDSGKEATWTFYVQIMPVEDGEKYKFDIFDVTKVWPHSDYPLIEVGKLVLNENPSNYFAEIEQAAFSPSSLVPGIEPSPDKMLQGRLLSYHDTHLYRLGSNYRQIPVNCPYRTRVTAYSERDGLMNVTNNGGAKPNYEPNSEPDGLVEGGRKYAFKPQATGCPADRYEFKHPNDDFVQAGNLYRKAMDDEQRKHLINNIVGHLGNARKEIQIRQTKLFFKADKDYGMRVAKGLGIEKEIDF